MESERGANCEARCRERGDANLSLLAPVAVYRAQSVSGIASNTIDQRRAANSLARGLLSRQPAGGIKPCALFLYPFSKNFRVLLVRLAQLLGEGPVCIRRRHEAHCIRGVQGFVEQRIFVDENVLESRRVPGM